jgi:hypothetical protein
MLLVLIIQILALGLAAVLAIKTDTVEVAVCVGTSAKDNGLPVNACAALALGSVVKLEGLQAASDLGNT